MACLVAILVVWGSDAPEKVLVRGHWEFRTRRGCGRVYILARADIGDDGASVTQLKSVVDAKSALLLADALVSMAEHSIEEDSGDGA
jgi:hypothetical protein